MIDMQKTEFLRNKIQQVRGSKDIKTPEQKEENKSNVDSASTIMLLAARFFAFYGALWIILTHVGSTPFTLLQSFIIFLSASYLLKTSK